MKIFFLSAIYIYTGMAVFSQDDGMVKDGPSSKTHTPQKKPIPYAPLREADMMWSKRIWRIIDLREKINHPLYFPITPILDRKSLFDVLKDGVLSGQLTAYANPVLDDSFTTPYTKSELDALLNKIDSVWYENEKGEQVMNIVPSPIESSEIIQYRVKEDWFFDKQRSVMEVRIVGIAPMREKKTESGEVLGYLPLFWIYFPEARHLLAKTEVYNRGNDAQRLTLDDLFWKRQFGSYIVKESNVYDRQINEYKTGLDVLLESERIKENISVYEENLWHY